MDVVGADAVVKLNMRFEFDLGNRYVVQAHCRPSYHAVDFVQVNRLQAAVAFGNFEIDCRIHRAFLRFGVLNRMGVGLELVFRRFFRLIHVKTRQEKQRVWRMIIHFQAA